MIDINGKFLQGSLNGVHRTAAHYASLLMERAKAEGIDIRLLCPVDVDPDEKFPHLVPTVRKGRFGAGQGWENFTLPKLSKGRLLVNFCNLGPVLHPNSIVMIHDAQTYLYPSDYSGRQATAYRMLLPVIGARAKQILTVSEFSRQSLAAHKVARLDKISVVHNGTDHILDVAPDLGILERHKLKPKSYVMVVGSAKGYKNIGRIFEAFAPPFPSDIPLVVAGGPKADAYLEKGVSVPKNAIFTGFIPDTDLRALYENAKVFAFPSRTEGFGLPPVEAMHCNTPVVAANAGAMPEVCADGAILVDPEDTQAWRDALLTVINSTKVANDLTRLGKMRADQLTWAHAGDRLWSQVLPFIK